MQIEQSGQPTGEVVSLDLAKKQCRVYHSDDDDLIEQMLAAAIEWVEASCSTVFLTTEFTATGSSMSLSFRRFPNPEIVSISYIDRLGVSGAVTEWTIRDRCLVVDDLPEVASVQVVFKAGLGAGNVPAKLIRAILMLTSYWNRQRESGSKDPMSSVPMGVSAMIAHHRSPVFA